MQITRTTTLALLFLLLFATAADAQYVGVTEEAFDGGQGVITYNRACNAAHPGSRMCTSEFASGPPARWGTTGPGLSWRAPWPVLSYRAPLPPC